MKQPNFFLAGALKCGTTALAHWMSEHPNIYMAPVKEPDFFYPGGKIRHREHYERLFQGAGETHLAVGEASGRYLTSESALRAAEAYTGGIARYVVILRNPVEMAESLHAQRLSSANESISSFEDAWRAQEQRRRADYRWPRHWYTPELNLYAETCRLGSQCNRLIDLVGRERVALFFFDDLKDRPQDLWRQVQAFLAVPDDGRTRFDAVNERRRVRDHALNRVLRRITQRPLWQQYAPRMMVRLGKRILMAPMGSETAISPELRTELIEFFREETVLLEQLTGRDLSHWRTME